MLSAFCWQVADDIRHTEPTKVLASGETLSPRFDGTWNLALSINAELRETGIVLLSIAQPDAFLQRLHLTGRLYPNAKLHRAQVASRKVHDFIDAANYQLEEIAWQSPLLHPLPLVCFAASWTWSISDTSAKNCHFDRTWICVPDFLTSTHGGVVWNHIAEPSTALKLQLWKEGSWGVTTLLKHIEAHLFTLYRTGIIQMMIRSTVRGLRILSQVFAFSLFTPFCVKHPSHEKDQERAATRHTFRRHWWLSCKWRYWAKSSQLPCPAT